jgi:hypothetical protein
MNEKTGRAVESGALIVTALLLLVGGRQLLAQLTQFPAAASFALVVIAGATSLGIRRHMRSVASDARLLVTRDLTYIAAVAFGLAAVVTRTHWAFGSCIVATEFALVLDIVGRFAPTMKTN